jgi:DNA ligase-associated metallophosphoesterase
MLLNGERLVPDVSGALWWPAQCTLVVADLHFEKATSFAARRMLLPPYDTRATLMRLRDVMRRYSPNRVICLGDSFHSVHGPSSLHDDDRRMIEALAGTCEWTWVLGNHDPALPNEFPGACTDALTIGALTLRHLPTPGRVSGEVIGHFHPKASVSVRGRNVTRRCFLTDGYRLVLPAFGSLAGGLNALDPAYETVLNGPCTAWLLGDRDVYPVSLSKSARKERTVRAP